MSSFHPFIECVTFTNKEGKNKPNHKQQRYKLQTSGFQPGFRGTLGCREDVLMVPPFIGFHNFGLILSFGIAKHRNNSFGVPRDKKDG